MRACRVQSIHFDVMTGTAVNRRFLRLVRLVALAAVPFHRRVIRKSHCLVGKLLVTSQASFPCRPERAVFPQKLMTFLAVHLRHLLNLDRLFFTGHVIRMAGGANLHGRLEPVQPHPVTGLAGDIVIFRMNFVPRRIGYLHPLRIAAIVTIFTGLVRDRRVISITIRTFQ